MRTVSISRLQDGLWAAFESIYNRRLIFLAIEECALRGRLAGAVEELIVLLDLLYFL